MALEARSSQGQLGASVASSQYLLLPMTKKKKKKNWVIQNLPVKKLSFVQSVDCQFALVHGKSDVVGLFLSLEK